MLTRSDICISTRCDTASRVFVGCALHMAVGFACPEADIEGEGLTREGIFLERVMNHAPRLVGVGGFESVVLYLAHTADRCIERLSEIEESVTEADGKSRRPALLCDALAIDAILAVEMCLLRCDGRIFVCEDIA